MATLDWIVLGLFCLALVGVIFYVLRKKDKDTSDYFLATGQITSYVYNSGPKTTTITYGSGSFRSGWNTTTC